MFQGMKSAIHGATPRDPFPDSVYFQQFALPECDDTGQPASGECFWQHFLFGLNSDCEA